MKTRNNPHAMMVFCLVIGAVSGFCFRSPAPPEPWLVQAAPQTVADIRKTVYGWPMPTADNSIGIDTPDGNAYIFGEGRFYVLNSAFPNRVEAEAEPMEALPLPEINGPGEAWKRPLPHPAGRLSNEWADPATET